MVQNKFKVASILSIIIVILAIISSLGGLLIPNLYRDNDFVTIVWHGNDLITLFAAIPLLIISLVLSHLGSLRGQLVWLGMLDYMLYNYAYYLFGTAFNPFFLIYVALFALSIYALIFSLSRIDYNGICQKFRAQTPVRWIAGYMLFVAMGLIVVYFAQSLNFVATGQLPQIVILSGHPTSMVFALDLTLVVPLFILGGIWLWNRKPWGYVLGVIANVKGVLYMLVLVLGTIFTGELGIPGTMAQLPLWIGLGVASLLASVVLLGNMKSK